MKKHWIVLVAILGLVVASASVWLWAITRPHESNAIAELSWHIGGKPMSASFQVADFDGMPLKGVLVHADNNSGGSTGTTDTTGSVTIMLGEPELSGIELNNVRVMDRSGCLQVAPVVTEGLQVNIRVKDLSAIRVARVP